jgi:hypothetical protein
MIGKLIVIAVTFTILCGGLEWLFRGRAQIVEKYARYLNPWTADPA